MPLYLTIRPAHTGDTLFLKSMLYEAAYWRPDALKPSHLEMLANDHIMRYLSDWGRANDTGVIAEDGCAQPLGAAWFRVFTGDCPGYGFIDECTPEVTIAVREDCRGNGIGTALLRELIHRAASTGLRALSLSVAAENPAVHLYEKLGFVKIKLVQGSWTMERRLRG